MCRFLIFMLVLLLILGGVTAVSAQEGMTDSEYLARAIATSYPEVSFGGKVAIASVAVNRKEGGYSETLAGAVAALSSEGEFEGLGKACGEINGELYRICRDAVTVAEGGADPTGGAIYFRSLQVKERADLRFDDTAEDSVMEEMRRSLAALAKEAGRSGRQTLIDGIGFY